VEEAEAADPKPCPSMNLIVRMTAPTPRPKGYKRDLPTTFLGELAREPRARPGVTNPIWWPIRSAPTVASVAQIPSPELYEYRQDPCPRGGSPRGP